MKIFINLFLIILFIYFYKSYSAVSSIKLDKFTINKKEDDKLKIERITNSDNLSFKLFFHFNIATRNVEILLLNFFAKDTDIQIKKFLARPNLRSKLVIFCNNEYWPKINTHNLIKEYVNGLVFKKFYLDEYCSFGRFVKNNTLPQIIIFDNSLKEKSKLSLK